MTSTEKKKFGIIILLVLIAIVAIFIGISKRSADSGDLPDVTPIDSESNSENDSVVSASHNASKGGSSGGSSGKKSARKVPAPSPKVSASPQDLEAALLKAIDENDQESVASLLSQIREDRKKYAGLIARLALDADMPIFIRASMISMMRDMDDRVTLDALLTLIDQVDESALRSEVIKSLGVRPEMETEQALLKIAENEDDPGRAMALSLLGGGKSDESRDALLAVIEEGSAATSEELNSALYSLRHYPDDEATRTLVGVAQDDTQSARIRATAIYSLGVIGDDAALSTIKDNLDSEEREVRYSATLAATRVSDASVTEALVPALCDISNYPHVRKAASAALAKNATPQDLQTLRDGLNAIDGFGIRLACDVFQARNDTAAITLLQDLAHNVSDSYVIEKLETTIALLEQGE